MAVAVKNYLAPKLRKPCLFDAINAVLRGNTELSLQLRIKNTAEIHGDFTLRSGKRSNTYFDKYRFESDPILLSDIAQAMAKLVPAATQVLCGLEMGGIPIVTMLSHHMGLPAAFIRKSPKSYGTCRYAEGAELTGKKILIVEDIVTSGGAIIDAARMLRADGLIADKALCVIDRETGGREKLNTAGIALLSLFTASEIDEASAKPVNRIP